MTAPCYRLINPQVNQSFVFKWEHFDLTTRWHYHPEVELIYFIEGSTSGIVGDKFQYFNEGDLVILGANFPHVLLENKEYVKVKPEARPFGLIIQFTENFLGGDFMNKPEMMQVKNLLKQAKKGVHFKKEAVNSVKDTLLNMYTLSEPRKLISLLDVLETLSETDRYDHITQYDFSYQETQDEGRMREIHQYIYEHFTEKISVRDIAGIANMTETSFCRYFKTRTLKQFTTVLNEIRISYACKLLSNTEYSITEVCFESGFNDLSYFTRQFKSLMNSTPTGYRKFKNGNFYD